MWVSPFKRTTSLSKHLPTTSAIDGSKSEIFVTPLHSRSDAVRLRAIGNELGASTGDLGCLWGPREVRVSYATAIRPLREMMTLTMTVNVQCEEDTQLSLLDLDH